MDKKELATLAIKYWQSVASDEELDVVATSLGSRNWVKLRTSPMFSTENKYQLVAPCHTELLLKHLNGGVEVECVGHAMTPPMRILPPQTQQNMWTDPNREIREVPPYKDDEVWWCHMGEWFGNRRALYYHTGGWFCSDTEEELDLSLSIHEGFQPLYKIGDLK